MTASSVEGNSSLDLANVLQNLPDDYLHCRGIQHIWNVTKDMHIVELTEDGHLVERHMVCDTCECLRRDRFMLRQDRWGVNRLEVMHPTYTYPEGYLLPETGAADHPREIVRYEMLTRALGGKAKVNRAMSKATAAE